MENAIGRFTTQAVDASSVQLQPPLDKIVSSDLIKLRQSHYYFDEPLFDEYELTTVRASWDFAAAESIVRNGHNVADLGCGDGRLLLHLADVRQLGDSVGIDISQTAINRFSASIPIEKRGHIHARRGDIFNIPEDITNRRFDVVTFGDATINFILDDEKLDELLLSARSQLRDADSRVMVSIFDDGTPEQLAFMDKRCTVVPFRQSDGRSALIWWAYKYDADRLIMHRSVFAQTGWDDDGDLEGVVSDLRDRMWTPSTVIPIAERHGLVVDRIIKSKVQDGSALGMGTAICILKST